MPSPTSWSSTTYVSLTYSQDIDALLGGTRWASSTITYSFPEYSSVWSTNTTTGYGPSSGSGEPWSVYYDILSTSDQTYFAAVLQELADIANLQFSLVADTSTSVGDIRTAYTPLSSGVQAHAYRPANSPLSGDVWFNVNGTSAIDYWTPGSYANFAVLHELGHALGLKHPFYEAGSISTILPSSLDTQSYTIMSYSAQPGDSTTNFSFYPTTPMILDIQAIQYVYGANNSYHSGNDTYSYSDATTYHETIWDAGGTDTIQYTGYRNSAIDLRSGYGSDIGGDVYQQSAYGVNLQAVNNVWIAYNVTIENAIGGSGHDILTGNDADNTLEGSAGNDTLHGGAGNDKFDWDSSRRAGTDIFYGGAGDDLYALGSTTDSVIEYAGEGTDGAYVYFSYSLVNLPNVEKLIAMTGSSSLALTGNSVINTIRGDAGNDTLDGGANFDFLTGGLGNDTYIVDDTLDLIFETSTLATEIDTVQSSISSTLGANLENLTLIGTAATDGTGNALDNTVTGNVADNSLEGGDGNDTLTGHAGNDNLTGGAGNDIFNVDAGTDTLTDAMPGTEIINISSGATAMQNLTVASVSYATNTTNNGKLVIGALLTTASTITGSSGDDNITCSSMDDSIDGGAGNDTLYGGAGNDKFDWDMSQRVGADIFYGGPGNDIYVLNNANDSVVEYAGEGIDTIYSDSYSLSNLPNVEYLRAFSNSTAVNFTGNSASNWFRGTSGNDTVDGGAGNDTMAYSGSRASYVITATASGYLIASTADGADTLTNIESAIFSDQTITLSAIDTTAPTVSTFSPIDAATGVAIASDIAVTFSEAIQRGTGSIVLKNAAGTVIETFDAANSSQLTISGATLTINPTGNLAYGTNYFVTFASGTLKDSAGNAYAGTTTYDFTTIAAATATTATVTAAAGNDILAGGSSNLDGGAGIDTVTYSAARAFHAVAKTSTGCTVSGYNLTNIERLHFSDVNLALDVGGNAGTAAKILGAVFGAAAVSNKTYMGIALDYLDGGMSYADLMAFALNAAGATTSDAVVTRLWSNLFGSVPTAAEAAPYVAMLDSGSYSAAALGVMAADTSFNAANINLVGLAQTGIEFA